MKKFFLLLTFFLFCLPFTVSADTAKSTIVMDLDSGRIFYEKNANQKRLIASITKIMTAIVAIEEGDLTEKITVGEEVLSMYGTNIYVEVYVEFGYNIVSVLRDFKQKVKREIERLTTMNVQEVSVLAKGIHMPDEKAKM